MKRLPGNKTRALLFLSLISILLLTLVACTGPQGLTGPAGTAGARGPTGPAGAADPGAEASFVVGTQIPKSAKTVTAYVSGFAPEKPIVISLKGTWKVSDVTIVDPGLQGGTGMASASGAAKITFDIATAISSYKLTPGVYTLMAEQGNILVTAPLEITEK